MKPIDLKGRERRERRKCNWQDERTLWDCMVKAYHTGVQ
jgi:hypothetical protein